MKEKAIRVLKVAPGEHPEPVTLSNDLDSLQKAVSIGADYQGLIEVLTIEESVCILCNEEGKLIGLEGNRRLGDDILCGVFYVMGSTPDGDFASLPKDKQERYSSLLWEPESFTKEDIDEATVMRFFPL